METLDSCNSFNAGDPGAGVSDDGYWSGAKTESPLPVFETAAWRVGVFLAWGEQLAV